MTWRISYYAVKLGSVVKGVSNFDEAKSLLQELQAKYELYNAKIITPSGEELYTWR